MNEQLEKVDAGASFFEAFIPNHPIITAILVAILCSWMTTVVFKLIIVRPLVQVKYQVAVIVLFDCLVAGAIVAYMWPGTHTPIWSFFIGSASPTIYAIVTGLLCWWKPGLRRFFTLRELAADDSPATGDEIRLPPGDLK